MKRQKSIKASDLNPRTIFQVSNRPGIEFVHEYNGEGGIIHAYNRINDKDMIILQPADPVLIDEYFDPHTDTDLCKVYSFRDEDIHLITRALRKMAETTGFGTIKADAEDLLSFIERQKKELGVK